MTRIGVGNAGISWVCLYAKTVLTCICGSKPPDDEGGSFKGLAIAYLWVKESVEGGFYD